jgi:hypothetical protein
MSPSAFLDRRRPPGDDELGAVLGRAMPHWSRLRDGLASAFPPVTATWSYSGGSHGWLLKLSRKKQTVVYLVPSAGRFVASFALREPAWQSAMSAGLPAAVGAILAAAPSYAEGRAVRIPVRCAKDVANVMTLAAIRMAH